MKITYPFIIVILLILVLLLVPSKCRTSHNVNVTERDSVVVNVTYRDTTIYNIVKRDSVITDYRLVSVTEFDTITIHDTTYIAIPIASYHFSDTMSDIWASGYRVTLDSVRYHLPEIDKTIFVESRKRWLSADAGGEIGRMTGSHYLSADIRGAVTIKTWSIEARAGLMTTGNDLTPFVGVGVRRKLW